MNRWFFLMVFLFISACSKANCIYMQELEVCVPEGFDKEAKLGKVKYVKKGEMIDIGGEPFQFPAVAGMEVIDDPLEFIEKNPGHIKQFYKLWNGDFLSVFVRKVIYKGRENFGVLIVDSKNALYAWGLSHDEASELFKKHANLRKNFLALSEEIEGEEVAPIAVDDIKKSLRKLKTK